MDEVSRQAWKKKPDYGNQCSSLTKGGSVFSEGKREAQRDLAESKDRRKEEGKEGKSPEL